MVTRAAHNAGPSIRDAVRFAASEFEFRLLHYRRSWRGTLVTGVLSPLLYLGAIGAGFGALVTKHGQSSLDVSSYLSYLAPGLLAATAMQAAMGESMFPVMNSLKWSGSYISALASPARPADIFHGHALFAATRVFLNCFIYMLIMILFGAARLSFALLALPAAILVGAAFACVTMAWSVAQNSPTRYDIVTRFITIPIFLFSGTFFPITRLPSWIRPLAYLTPLWHGVSLCRDLALDRINMDSALGNVGYLGIMMLTGIIMGNHMYRKRLYV